jgi:curved DNA-binding protein CbpA
MSETSARRDGLAQIAEVFRARRTGLLVVGEEPDLLRVQLAAGQIVALGPAPPEGKTTAAMPKPSDSVRLRLERVLIEIGMRKAAATPEAGAADAPPTSSLRDRLIQKLVDHSVPVRFEENGEQEGELVAVAVATEPLILEAVRQLRDERAVLGALGDVDQLLLATSAFADERTLTLTEGYLLSRIDGIASAREVLDRVPLDRSEVERTLLGLLLTGRVEMRPASQALPLTAEPPLEATPEPDAEAEGVPSEPAPAPPVVAEEPPPTEPMPVSPDFLADVPAEQAPPLEATPLADELDKSRAAPELPPDAGALSRRRNIVEMFQSLPLKQSHFEVLGVEPGCTDDEVKRAYVALTKRYHPDANRDKRLSDLQDMLEAIIIRVGEAWEVLGEAKSRASYEARAGIGRRSGAAGGQPTVAPHAYERRDYVPPEEILFRARRLLLQARYWDAIQVLESALPAMEPRSQQHRGRLLLARAYAKNPNWLRRAEETLQELMKEDPTNADAYYELGLVYKTGGFPARAQAMFRRTLELRPGHKEASAELGLQAEGTAGSSSGNGGLLRRLFKRGKAS